MSKTTAIQRSTQCVIKAEGRVVNLLERAFRAMNSELKAHRESEISAEIGEKAQARASEVCPFRQRVQQRPSQIWRRSVSEGDGVKRLFGRIEASHRVVRFFRFLRSHRVVARVVQSVNCLIPDGSVRCDNGLGIA